MVLVSRSKFSAAGDFNLSLKNDNDIIRRISNNFVQDHMTLYIYRFIYNKKNNLMI